MNGSLTNETSPRVGVARTPDVQTGVVGTPSLCLRQAPFAARFPGNRVSISAGFRGPPPPIQLFPQWGGTAEMVQSRSRPPRRDPSNLLPCLCLGVPFRVSDSTRGLHLLRLRSPRTGVGRCYGRAGRRERTGSGARRALLGLPGRAVTNLTPPALVFLRPPEHSSGLIPHPIPRPPPVPSPALIPGDSQTGVGSWTAGDVLGRAAITSSFLLPTQPRDQGGGG